MWWAIGIGGAISLAIAAKVWCDWQAMKVIAHDVHERPPRGVPIEYGGTHL